jgi:DNA polymerase/3'-5' exonuclease PolX
MDHSDNEEPFLQSDDDADSTVSDSRVPLHPHHHSAVPAEYSYVRNTYMGVCQLLPNLPHRRIDMKVYPRELAAFAMLYFTGSDHFNRSMRLYARNHGFHLSDKGLYRAVLDHQNQSITLGKMIPCTTEKEIFEQLGLQYKDPWERNSVDVMAADAAKTVLASSTVT